MRMATLSISLPPETEARLRERAAAEGKDLQTYVVDALREKVAPAGANVPARSPDAADSVDAWLARFDAWTASHPRFGGDIDDSRESIYAGRGE